MMQEFSTIDDLPATNVELEPEPEKIEDRKDGGPSFHCDLYDTELVHKIAQAFIPGLATACVDSTSGDIFKTPASVAADVRREMVEYITQRSQNFVAESVILEGGQDDHPYDIISDFVDDFASSKRNLFSRVSGWLMSEKREDYIDDFVQEMEINGFWLIDKREAIAQTLLKNVDLKNEHHCDMKFHTSEELEVHILKCGYRSMSCINEGCNARFCASYADKHDAVCPFKIIPCEQNCSDMIMRRDMDRHCITVCLMKLVSCPFYAVGCQSPIPHSKLELHRSDDLHSHMLFVLQSIHKEASTEDLKRRLKQLKDASSSNSLALARDVRLLTSAIKDLEAKLGPMEISKKQQENLEPEPKPEEAGSKNPELKPEDREAKPAQKEVSRQKEYLEAKSEPKEASSKSVEDLEPAPKESSTKAADNLEAKSAQKGVSSSKPPEDVEARVVEVSGTAPTGLDPKSEPKEVGTRPVEDLEAKPAPTELSDKPAEDHAAKPAPEEVSSSKPPEDVEEKTMGVSAKAPTGDEAKHAPKEPSIKPAEDLEVKPAPKEDAAEKTVGVRGKASTGREEELVTKEMASKPPEELEPQPGTREVGSQPSEGLEPQPGTKEVGSKPSEGLETQ